MSASTYRRIAVALAFGALLLLSPPVVSGGLIWDIGLGFGYLTLVLVLCLYLFPVRGDGLPHRRLLGLSQHRLVGWWTLGVASIHVVILIGTQPSVVRYLLPSGPVFMWCGLAALILTGFLVQTGLTARSAMRRPTTPGRPVKFATLHVVLAAALILTACLHIAGSAQVVSGLIKTGTVALLVALPIVWLIIRPRSQRSPGSVLRRATHVSALALIPLMPWSGSTELLMETAARPARIAVKFPHESHTSVNCVACHHNFVDHSGTLACIECHRAERTDLPHSSEVTFHVFCRDCHSRLALEGGVRHGPTRACSACH